MLMVLMNIILMTIVEKGSHHSSDQVTVLSNMSKFYNLTIITILTFCVFDEVLVSFLALLMVIFHSSAVKANLCNYKREPSDLVPYCLQYRLPKCKSR